MTLMHYLCKVLASKGSDLLDFHKDLGSLESASKSFDFPVDSDTIEVAGGGNVSCQPLLDPKLLHLTICLILKCMLMSF
ncbi:unnamed protein product [Brassica oleracea]